MNHSPHTRSLAAVPARARVRARACMKRVSYHLLLDRLPVGGRLPRTSADAGATNALPHILPVRHCQKRLLVGPARSLPDVLDLFVWALEHKDVAAHGHLLALAKAAKCNHAVPLALDFLELKRAGHALQRPPCPLAVRGPATRGRRLVFGAHARAAGAPLCGRRPVRPPLVVANSVFFFRCLFYYWSVQTSSEQVQKNTTQKICTAKPRILVEAFWGFCGCVCGCCGCSCGKWLSPGQRNIHDEERGEANEILL